MKKLFCFALAILISATTLISCNIPPDEPNVPNDNAPSPPPIGDDEYDDIIVGDNPGKTDPPADNPPEDNPPEDNLPEDNPPVDNPPIDIPPVDTPPSAEAPESSQVAIGFVAKQKKYDYGEKNIMILNVTNQNKENYVVTITGYYLDSTGNVLKSETQTVQGYVAEYEKYFLFNPEIAFDNFVFTLKAEKYDGECIDHLFKLENLRLEHKTLTPPVGEALLDLAIYGDKEYLGKLDYRMHTQFIVIGNDGKVYCIKPRNFGNNVGDSYDDITLDVIWSGMTSDKDLVPEVLNNNVTIIVVHRVGELTEFN